MTEHSQSPAVKGILFLLGLCGCLLLAWVAVPVIWPSQSNQEMAEGVGSSEEESPDEASGKTIETASATSASTKDVAATEKPPLGQIKILVPTKKFRKEGPRKAFRVSYDDIDIEKVLNTKELSVELPQKMPSWLQELNGKRIRILGYMHPGSAFQSEGIKRFTLCRDTSACCFGPDPTIFYLIETTMKSGTSTSYVEAKAVDIEGIFRIEPVVHESGIAQFYHLDDAQVVKGGR